MPASDARVITDRAVRYLTQLCKHTDHMTGHHPGAPSGTEWSETEGTIEFPSGRCTLRADTEALTLRAEAPDDDRLRRIQESLTTRLHQISTRNPVTITWRPRH